VLCQHLRNRHAGVFSSFLPFYFTPRYFHKVLFPFHFYPLHSLASSDGGVMATTARDPYSNPMWLRRGGCAMAETIWTLYGVPTAV
jgi:hypothetical protein